MDYIKDPGLNLLHISADSLFQTPWEIHPHALTADFKKYKESVLWALIVYIIRGNITCMCVPDRRWCTCS